MMTTYFTDNAIISGASVIGKSHVINETPNQDSFKIKRKKYGVCMCVCDGVGSNKYSQHGSKAACKAVAKVFKLYKQKKVTKDNIGKQIERYYKKFVKRKYSKSAGTTCLFAMVFANNEILLGQAGDGIILTKIDDKFIVFKNKKDEFVNETSTLCCNRDFNNRKIKNLKFDVSSNKRLEILLSTDGISEDVLPEKRELFFDYFISLTTKNKHSKLHDELKNRNVPGSIDDKTVITFSWRN